MAECDLCGVQTSRAKSPSYKADDIRRIVANGFTLDEGAIASLSQARGVGREQATTEWEQKVAQASADWLLCPACVSRVAPYYRQADKRRGSRWWLVAGAAVLLLVAGLAWLVLAAPKANSRSLRGPSNGVVEVAFSPDGGRLVSLTDDTLRGGAERMVLVWDVASGRIEQQLSGFPSRLTSLAYSPDGRWLALAGNETTVHVFDAATWQEARKLDGHTLGVTDLAFSPDGQSLASSSHDATVKLWALDSAQAVHTLGGHDSGVNSLAFSPDGQHVAGGSGNGCIIVWNTSSGQAVYTLTAHQGNVSSLAFGPSEQILASAGHDAQVKLWNASDGRALRTLGIHPGGANSLAFSPDGQALASGGEDGLIKLWNLATGQEVGTLSAYQKYAVSSLAYSPDGTLLASGNWFDAKLWQMAAQSMATAWPSRTSRPSAFASPTLVLQASAKRSTATPLPDDLRGSFDKLPSGERWQTHLRQDLLPFWEMDTALGQPLGNFPTYRCNDGALYDPAKPCVELQASWLRLDRDYVRMKSRQIFAYGVAYHMTGDETYLRYAAAGVEYLRSHALDRENGGAFSYWQGKQRQPGPAVKQRTSQDLAYALTGMSFYYYLTRDEAVLQDILSVKQYIFDSYYDADSDLLTWVLQNSPDGDKTNQKELVAQLDQVNGYMLLVTPLLKDPHRSEWEKDLVHLARIMIDQFYSPEQNLFWGTLTDDKSKSLGSRHTDFGHSSKAFWMIYQTGKWTGDDELVSFAQAGASRLLKKAYIPLSNSWASRLDEKGDLDVNKEWWIYAELDQTAASLALRDAAQAVYLPGAYDYWLSYMVDHKNKEIWPNVAAANDQPVPDSAKQHFWKNAYHSFEHALVGYITSQQLHDQPVTLYFAFQSMPAESSIHPYFYTGDILDIQAASGETAGALYEVTFANVR